MSSPLETSVQRPEYTSHATKNSRSQTIPPVSTQIPNSHPGSRSRNRTLDELQTRPAPSLPPGAAQAFPFPVTSIPHATSPPDNNPPIQSPLVLESLPGGPVPSSSPVTTPSPPTIFSTNAPISSSPTSVIPHMALPPAGAASIPSSSISPAQLDPSIGPIADSSTSTANLSTNEPSSLTVITLPTSGKRWPWIQWRPTWRIWCLLAMIIALAVGIPLGFGLRVKDISITGGTQNATIELAANLVSVDPDQQTVTIDWEVDYTTCGESNTTCGNIDIFFDLNLLRFAAGSIPSDNNVPATPIFSINGSAWNNPLGNVPFFRTEIALFGGGVGTKERTLQAYPFDRYGAAVVIFAMVNNDTEDFFDFDNPVTISINDTSGIAAGFTSTISSSQANGFIILQFDIFRGAVVRVYAIVIVISIWLVTLTLLSATVSSVLLGRKIAKEVLLVPVATLFAFTQLRGTLPGAPPGFGAIIDFVGILPCLSLLTFCSVFMLAVFLFRNPEVDRSPVHKKTV